MSEATFYRALRPHLPGYVKRVENAVHSGDPDVEGIYLGKPYYIELKEDNRKSCKLPGFPTASGMCTPLQVATHLEMVKGGLAENVFVVIRQGRTLFAWVARDLPCKYVYCGAYGSPRLFCEWLEGWLQ
jgi:hypothetical protein